MHVKPKILNLSKKQKKMCYKAAHKRHSYLFAQQYPYFRLRSGKKKTAKCDADAF